MLRQVGGNPHQEKWGTPHWEGWGYLPPSRVDGIYPPGVDRQISSINIAFPRTTYAGGNKDKLSVSNSKNKKVLLRYHKRRIARIISCP